MLLQNRYCYYSNSGVHHYCFGGNCHMVLSHLWYYCRIFPIPMVITAVVTVLPCLTFLLAFQCVTEA